MSIRQTFNRLEYKYYLNEEQHSNFLCLTSSHLIPDDFGLYQISSIYFDTPDFQLAKHAIYSPSNNKKIRLRKYSFLPVANDSIVHLECKEKIASRTNKTRQKILYKDFDLSSIFSQFLPNENHESIYPQIQIDYNRQAYRCVANPDLRITIDKNVSACINKSNSYLLHTTCTTDILPPATYLLEIKFSECFPQWLVDILQNLSVSPQNYSKYLSAYKLLISG